jgi:hypothetical protein
MILFDEVASFIDIRQAEQVAGGFSDLERPFRI